MEKYLPTGFAKLDHILKESLVSNDLIFLTGLPNTGKTSLITNIAYNIAGQIQDNTENKTIALYSFELSKEQIIDNIMARIMKIPLAKLIDSHTKKDALTDQESWMYNMLETKATNKPLTIIDTEKSVDDIINDTQSMTNLDLIIIDYLYILKNWSWNDFYKFKDLSQKLNIPIIVVAQLQSEFEITITPDTAIEQIEGYDIVKQYADKIIVMTKEKINNFDKILIHLHIYSPNTKSYIKTSLCFDPIYRYFTERLSCFNRIKNNKAILKIIAKYIDEHPDMRFIQILWNMKLINSNDGVIEDRYSEEPYKTLKKLTYSPNKDKKTKKRKLSIKEANYNKKKVINLMNQIQDRLNKIEQIINYIR